MNRVSDYLRSNALGLVAIYLALGGIAWAANLQQNSVASKHIINGQVKAADIGNGAVRTQKIAAGAVTSAKVADDSLTGADVDEASLDPAILQRRLEGACPAGQAVRAVSETGAVTCEAIGGSGLPSGPAGGDLTGNYPNPEIRVPANLAGSSSSTPTLTAQNTGTTGVAVLAEGYWGLFGSSGSSTGGATGVAALATGAGGHGLTAVATGDSGTAVDAEASGPNATALEARASGSATRAARFQGSVEIAGPMQLSGSNLGDLATLTKGRSDHTFFSCNPGQTLVACAEVEDLVLPRAARVLILGAGSAYTATPAAGRGRGFCRPHVNGGVTLLGDNWSIASVGDPLTAIHIETAPNPFSLNVVTPVLSPGTYDFALACREEAFSDGDFAVLQPHVSAVVLGSG